MKELTTFFQNTFTFLYCLFHFIYLFLQSITFEIIFNITFNQFIINKTPRSEFILKWNMAIGNINEIIEIRIIAKNIPKNIIDFKLVSEIESHFCGCIKNLIIVKIYKMAFSFFVSLTTFTPSLGQNLK